jgi:glycolate oxidase FAD binding subunit
MDRPATPAELAAALADHAAARRVIRLGGAFTKDRLGGTLFRDPAAVITTARLNRILQYEPRDLTISVEAGLPWRDLQEELRKHNQMIPLDPPWHDAATVGGVLAANQSGPRRRYYGTARDCVIGMTFATLEGQLLRTGGIVVKNVAGLDLAKLLIGSWGTLAAIAVANFKVFPIPPATRTFVFSFPDLAAAIAARDRIVRSVLQPAAMDLLNPAAAERIGRAGWILALQAGGNRAVLDRYRRELPAAAVVEDDAPFWRSIREFTPDFFAAHPRASQHKRSTTLSEQPAAIAALPGPVVARAASGVSYGHAIDDAPPNIPAPGGFEIMSRIKRLFDPEALLNPGRLHGLL